MSWSTIIFLCMRPMTLMVIGCFDSGNLRSKGASIAQLVENPDLQSIDHRFSPYCRWVLSWYGLLVRLSLQIASVASEHHGNNNGGPNQWIIRVKITARLLKVHLSLFDKSSRVSAGDV